MRISPQWLREFTDLKVDDRQLADDLTLAGVAVESVREQDGQLLFEMEIGTNRPDAMCHYGVARECSAIYNTALKPVAPRFHHFNPAAAPFPIEIQDAKGCARYTGRVIRNVQIGPSPAKILDRLKIDDHGGVSNAVDASNYALMEIGHPTHAFDLDRLEGGRIIVRRARLGETLKTLDGVDRKLDPEDLIIADAARPVALAGIMGGLDSAISGSTKNILIEAAWFDPATVRKTARRLGMHTDASHIFERGADWGATRLAADRVAELILEFAGGELEGEPVDVIARHLVRYSIWLRRSEILRLLGQEIPEETVVRILERLGFKLTPVTPAKTEILEKLRAAETPEQKQALVLEAVRVSEITGLAAERILPLIAASHNWGPSWMVDLPTWRLDIEREIDLIEEIARVYGYNKFPDTLPAFSGGVVEPANADKKAKIRSTLLALGYNEAISPTFIAEAEATEFSSSTVVPLANPLSNEQSVMRTSLAPGMLNMLSWNLNRGTSDVRLFETGHVFSSPGSSPGQAVQENPMLCLGATGRALEPSVHGPGRAYSFFDLKGDIETLLSAFDIRNLRFEASSRWHPGRCAQAVSEGVVIAEFGQISHAAAAARKLKQEICIAEIYLDRLLRLPLRTPRYQALSKFPAVERDFSFTFADSVGFDQIQSTVQALHIPELKSFQPAEIFRGGTVAAGKYSILLRAQFQSSERTLTDDEVAQWWTGIMKALEAIGGSLRS
ncbi:MAG TPA: phenylalanine--tRNA ligase subunit beta [Candidatus Angelobacter sp.]|nr:phenylalanine--tRNA ligase subunit beta [Candidatus Angelobacter sp.]